MLRNEIIQQIKRAHQLFFPDVELVLFGSEARGQATLQSDIDLLALVNKNHITNEDRERIAHPLYEIELQTNTIITPIIRSKQQWETQPMSYFKKNIIAEGITL
jgi:predicted nucleotidyltransferase